MSVPKDRICHGYTPLAAYKNKPPLLIVLPDSDFQLLIDFTRTYFSIQIAFDVVNIVTNIRENCHKKA
jgi:hypothetical protein